MIKIIDKKIETISEENRNKKQIILTHTSRNIEEYLVSLRYRFNKKYNKIPHFVIDRSGNIIQTLDETKYGKYFNDEQFDKQSIIITLENLGWLQKEPLKNYHINWIGSIYKEKVFNKKWREYFFWEPYTQIQLDKTAELCKKISKEFSIDLNCVGHNTKMNKMETFSGILTKSNIYQDSTDVSPAFDFEYFIKKLDNE